jgi:hypothetical protein
VGHAGGPEVLLQGRLEPAGVADHQAGQKSAGGVRERLARALQAGTERTGGPLRPRGPAVQLGRRTHGQHRGTQVATPRRQ